MKILVCGGRDYRDCQRVFDVLDKLHAQKAITLIIAGMAPGADSHSFTWASDRGVFVHGVPANWQKHGRAAGPIRNRQMLDLAPDLVVAFPGGRGTADMVRQAIKAGVHVVQVSEHDASCVS